MQRLRINKNRVVALRYTMRNGKGEIVEDIIAGSPIHYLHGSTEILPMLQQQLEDLKAGDKKKIFLSKENSEADDDFIFDVVIDGVRAALSEEIMLGYPLSVTSEICTDDCYCYEESKK